MEEKTTSNFYLVAAYLCFGGLVERVDHSDPAHIEFTVKGNNLSDTKSKWESKELQVSARDYADAIREVKAMLYQKG